MRLVPQRNGLGISSHDDLVLADDGSAPDGVHADLAFFALFALFAAHAPHGFELGLQARDAFADMAAVGFELGLARAARSDRAFAAGCGLAREVAPLTGQGRERLRP